MSSCWTDRTRWRKWLASGAIFLLTVFAYLPAWAQPSDTRLFSDSVPPSGSLAEERQKAFPGTMPYIRSRLIQVNLDVLKEPQALSGKRKGVDVAVEYSTWLKLFDDVEFEVKWQRANRRSFDEGFTLFGRLEGLPYSEVILVSGDNGSLLSINTTQEQYTVKCYKDQSCLAQQVNPDVRIDFGDDVITIPFPKKEETPDSKKTNQGSKSGGGEPYATNAADSGDTIDVLVLYTGKTIKDFGTVEDLRERIETSVGSANSAYINSGINLQIKFLGTQYTDYQESGSGDTGMDNAVNWLSSNETVKKIRDGSQVIKTRTFLLEVTERATKAFSCSNNSSSFSAPMLPRSAT